MFAAGQGTKASEVFDGTSKTALLSEVVPFDTNKPISVDIRGVWVGASIGREHLFTSHRTQFGDA